MNTFKDLLRVVATTAGETVVIQPVSVASDNQYDIRSEPYRPKGYVTCNAVEVLRFRFGRGKVRFRLPNRLRWYTFAIDDSLVALSRIRRLGNGTISALLRYSPTFQSSSNESDR